MTDQTQPAGRPSDAEILAAVEIIAGQIAGALASLAVFAKAMGAALEVKDASEQEQANDANS